ncbi:MAG: excalibur calcium-binding domain-containing protein, partial [Gaiellales bacterium]
AVALGGPVAASTAGGGAAAGGGASSAAAGGLDPRFAYCTQAIAAGYGPYVKGVDTEYAWYRDGDGDGVACER